MQYLATIGAAQDGDGDYVVQTRYQYPHDERPGAWVNVDYFDPTREGAYDAAWARASELSFNRDVVAARVVQVKEWMRCELAVESDDAALTTITASKLKSEKQSEKQDEKQP